MKPILLYCLCICLVGCKEKPKPVVQKFPPVPYQTLYEPEAYTIDSDFYDRYFFFSYHFENRYTKADGNFCWESKTGMPDKKELRDSIAAWYGFDTTGDHPPIIISIYEFKYKQDYLNFKK